MKPYIYVGEIAASEYNMGHLNLTFGSLTRRLPNRREMGVLEFEKEGYHTLSRVERPSCVESC